MDASALRGRVVVSFLAIASWGCGSRQVEDDSAEPLVTRQGFVTVADDVGTPAGPDPAAPASTLVPRLPSLAGVVKDERLARVLGKAFFWDQQVGSDGAACASCRRQPSLPGRHVRLQHQHHGADDLPRTLRL